MWLLKGGWVLFHVLCFPARGSLLWVFGSCVCVVGCDWVLGGRVG